MGIHHSTREYYNTCQKSVLQVKNELGPIQQSMQAWDSWPLLLLLLMCFHCGFASSSEFFPPPADGDRADGPDLRGQDSYTDTQEVIATSFLDFLIVSCKKQGLRYAEIPSAFQRGSIIIDGILSLLVKSKNKVLSALSSAALWIARKTVV